MREEVFHVNKMMQYIFIVVVAAIFIGVIIYSDLPVLFVLLPILIGGLLIFSISKTRILINEGVLYYEKLGRKDRVSLKDVAFIMQREVETIVEVESRHRDSHQHNHQNNRGGIVIQNQPTNQERKVERIIYLLDGKERTFFSFPAHLIRMKDRDRFIQSVHGINPEIEIHL